jgi:peptidoglycan/xylan/chitin deacetylase (PgdA/CDA1 family)
MLSSELFTTPAQPGVRARLLPAARWLQSASRLSVLIFHRVLSEFDPLRPAEPTEKEFEARMRWVAANFDVLPLADAIKALKRDQLPKRALCITFDDGYADNYDLALPILHKLQVPATFFIATGYLDGGCMFNDIIIEAVRGVQAPIFDLGALNLGQYPVATLEDRRRAIAGIIGRLKYLEPRQRQDLALRAIDCAGTAAPADLMMTSEQVAALHAAGMEIGAHTVSHPILAELGLEAARAEIACGRRHLEELTGAPVRVFAYPNGQPGHDYRREHVALVHDLGFDGAVSTAWGAARAGADIFQIPRFTPWDRSDLRFELRMIGNLWRSCYDIA